MHINEKLQCINIVVCALKLVCIRFEIIFAMKMQLTNVNMYYLVDFQINDITF